MHIDDLDEVTRLSNWRNNALQLKECAKSCGMDIKLLGGPDVSSVMDVSPIRQTIRDECDRLVTSYEEQLRVFGVECESALLDGENPDV